MPLKNTVLLLRQYSGFLLCMLSSAVALLSYDKAESMG
jgi:hypothetical protein